jgi:hypothetical protein
MTGNQVVSTCLNSTPIITWLDSYFRMMEMKTLDLTISLQVVTKYS